MSTTGARALREDDQPLTSRRGRFERAPAEPTPLRPRGNFDGPARGFDGAAPGERRTVTITGHPVPPRRRRSPTHEQIVARPDRVALWAFLLGLFLVLVAAATANAAPL
jgi:hypothetical protein